jgi:hypothetical protein
MITGAEKSVKKSKDEGGRMKDESLVILAE